MDARDLDAGLRARVIHGFKGVADGEIYPRLWNPGDEITGSLARAAIGAGHAKALPAPTNKALPGAPENKAAAGNADGPSSKATSSSSRPRARRKAQKT